MAVYNINISDKALEKALEYIRKHKEKNPQDTSDFRLRVKINAGGCSGFQYDFYLDKERNFDDIVFGKGDSANGKLEIIADEKSMIYLHECTIDFKDGLSGAGFDVINPNATGGCGCGKSFSV
ncbi:iron-sulfur cluster assembly accessory protein [Candidatus Woesearchaeota archaeon]|nr:iron-sulfur cluster assembly accessory protein [Candidatus Woesearchaeota archaeon]